MIEQSSIEGKRVALVYPERLEASPLYDLRDFRVQNMKKSLEACGCRVESIPRDALPDSLDDFYFVVSAGGDGTQLDTALRLCDPENSYICAVRLFPERSVGFLCNVDYDDFDSFIKNIASNESPLSEKCEPLPRLQCLLDDILIKEPILNDVLITHACPARASRYSITFNQSEQKHCSSGIWVATNAGSHAAAHAAGAPALDRSDPLGCIFCVRELSQFSSLEGWNDDEDPIRIARFIPGEDVLCIKSLSSSMHLYFDGGLVEYSVLAQQKITFRYHKALLRRLKTV